MPSNPDNGLDEMEVDRQPPSLKSKISSSSSHLQRQGLLITAGSLLFLFFGLFCLLGGTERLFLFEENKREEAIYLSWPFSIFYFWPLVIPLGTYFTIARWTGYKHFRHA